MTGSAKTDQFQFSVASVLVGPQADQLNLNAEKHSIGLVKNVMAESNPTQVELTQGLQNDVVFSAVNNMQFKISAEVYEYTARNLAYGLSLDASSGTDFLTVADFYPVHASISAAAATVTIGEDVTTDFTAGTWGFIQEGTGDQVHIFKVVSSAFASTVSTVTFVPALPTGVSFTTAARVGLFNKIDADPDAAATPLSVRIIGNLVKDKRPLVLHFPKVRILKGFSVRFSSDAFGNLPFEFTPYKPLPSDPGYSADFKQRMTVFTP